MRNNNLLIIVAIIGAVIAAWLLLNLTGDVVRFVLMLLAWMFAGTLAGRLLRGRGYGLVMDILLGLVGGIVGNILFGLLGLGGIGNIPLIGATKYPNLFLNTGHGTLGWTLACGSGKILADVIGRRKPEVEA